MFIYFLKLYFFILFKKNKIADAYVILKAQF